MTKVVFRDITGIIYSAKYLETCQNIMKVQNLQIESKISNMTHGVVNLKNKGSEYDGEVRFNINNIIWYSFQEV
ncbi:hypothetical protein CF069_13360 [Clostridium botulinum]